MLKPQTIQALSLYHALNSQNKFRQLLCRYLNSYRQIQNPVAYLKNPSSFPETEITVEVSGSIPQGLKEAITTFLNEAGLPWVYLADRSIRLSGKEWVKLVDHLALNQTVPA